MRTGVDGRLRREDGIQLAEVLVATIVIAVLVAIAIPSYLAVEARSLASAAKSNIRSALPAIEAYRVDHGDFAFDEKIDGAPAASPEDALRSYAGTLGFTGPHAIAVASVDGGASYCVSAAGAGDEFWRKDGPAGSVVKSSSGC